MFLCVCILNYIFLNIVYLEDKFCIELMYVLLR